MRTITQEKKEFIAKTPITIRSFDMNNFNPTITFVRDSAGADITLTPQNIWNGIVKDCEALRQKYIKTKDERYYTELIRLLPRSYRGLDFEKNGGDNVHR